MDTRYKVNGMSCGGCASAVTKAIQKALPGAEVDVDLDAAEVKVSAARDDDAVRQAVEKAGFDFEGITT